MSYNGNLLAGALLLLCFAVIPWLLATGVMWVVGKARKMDAGAMRRWRLVFFGVWSCSAVFLAASYAACEMSIAAKGATCTGWVSGWEWGSKWAVGVVSTMVVYQGIKWCIKKYAFNGK